MKNHIWLLVLSLCLAGCASSKAFFISKNFQPKSGRVELHWNAMGSEEKSRAEAEALMMSFCTPQKPRVTGESIESTGVVKYSQNKARAQKEPVITFECVD